MRTLSEQIENMPLGEAIKYLAKYIQTEKVLRIEQENDIRRAIAVLRYDLQEEINRQEAVRVIMAENPGKWSCPYPDEKEV